MSERLADGVFEGNTDADDDLDGDEEVELERAPEALSYDADDDIEAQDDFDARKELEIKVGNEVRDARAEPLNDCLSDK